MKKYFKYLFTILLVCFIIPQIAFASWWNPFSWKIFNRTDTKTQVLENRIKELENKLNVVAPTAPVVKDVVKTTPKQTVSTSIPAPASVVVPPVVTLTPNTYKVPARYVNPKTGNLYTATEYAQSLIAECASQNKVVDKLNISNDDGTPNCITDNQDCQNKFGVHSIWDGKYCNCVSGYTMSLDGKQCILYDQKCKDKYGSQSMWDGFVSSGGLPRCGCADGYEFRSAGTPCQLKQTSDYNPPWANSGTSFSPEQLNAMDCATYGINCPTINVHIVK
jgi:hypothetical protein